YKVSTHKGQEDVAAFLANEQERYRVQMERYGRALWGLEPGRPIRLALLFPLVREHSGALGWREWDYVPLVNP
ncbi:MAG TPA: hypothetical protein VL359_16585, partial [bacterium]|nr:hypothetical protein [bacterium]